MPASVSGCCGAIKMMLLDDNCALSIKILIAAFTNIYIKPYLYFCTMIVYNDTVILDDAIEQEWLQWIKEVHIPAIMETGCFSSYRILNIIDSPNDGVTYCIQYNADNIESFNNYYTNHLYKFQEIHQQRFDERFVMFNTLMKTVD
jgi:hypothetical protein